MARWRFSLVVALALLPAAARGHPVPKENHDRAITVRITPAALLIEYRLELDRDGWTIAKDLREALADRDEWAKLTSEAKVYEAFARTYAPLLAGNLTVKLDGQDLKLELVPPARPVITDSVLFPLVFRHSWQLQPGQPYQLTFYEGNYETDEGQIKVSIVADGSVRLLKTDAADEATKNRPYAQRRPGDEKRLRRVSATFELTEPPAAMSALPESEPPTAEGQPEHGHGLLGLLFDTRIGFWALLGLAAGFGAIHALTPGHGKTLVAAYLVGENGTIWHAVLLGLVTTFTHTSIVIAFAIGLDFVPWLAPTLYFISGLLVAGLGFWLLLKRLGGGPDHVHLGGSDHHHDHHPHHHGEPGASATGALSSWGLIALGVSGGIVPCWDAIAMLMIAIAAGKASLGLPLVLAFSAGLAGVLVVIGILVVRLKTFAESRWGESRLFRILPLVSAAFIFVMGMWLCYASLHAAVPPSAAVAAGSGN